jgi:hypothetical protein
LTFQLEAHIGYLPKRNRRHTVNNLSKIKKTIMALRARAADVGSSEGEIATALARAEKLMRENRISVQDLSDAAQKGGIIRKEWTKGTKKIHMVELVAGPISQLTDTKGWISTIDGVASLVYVGFEADAEYAMYLTDLIHNAMESEWAKVKESWLYQSTPSNKRGKMRSDFMRSMLMVIRGKLTDMAVARRGEVPVEGSDGHGALVVAKRAMIAETLSDMGLKIRKRRQRKVKVGIDAYAMGTQAGNRTQIKKGIEA